MSDTPKLMDAQLLIQQLAFLEPEKRLAAARIIGLTDEVDAYPALYRAVKTEADPAVKKAMAWAGKRLQAAQAAEYTTIDAIWEYFHIDRDVYPPDDDRDEPFLGLNSHQAEMVTAQVQYESALRKTRQGMYALGGQMLGSIAAGVIAAASSSGVILEGLPTVLEPSVGVNTDGRRRAIPAEPTTTEIRAYVKRLLSEPDAEKRRKAALSLRDLNNPAALDPLALAFMRDPEPQVAQTAHLAGKLIYWNAVYWKLEKEGWIAEEIAHRIRLAEEEQKSKRKIRRLSQATPTQADSSEAPTQPAVPTEPSRPAIRRLPKPNAAPAPTPSEAPTQHARPIAPDHAPKTKPKRSESVIPQMPTQNAEKEAIERLLQKGMAKRRRP